MSNLPTDNPSMPATAAPAKKPIYKRVWFIALAVIVVLGVIGSMMDKDKSKSAAPSNDVASQSAAASAPEPSSTAAPEMAQSEPQPAEAAPAPEPAPAAEPEVPTEFKSALRKAESYSEVMHMSKAGIYHQLTSEHGEKFSPEAAQYAVDNVKADWNANALAKAKNYQDIMSMSPSAIYDQLTSEHGEKFTPEEAQYAIDNLQ